PQASVLFTPMELRMYQRWRFRYIYEESNEDFTPVPNAFEYAVYQEWHESERARCLPRNFIDASDATDDEDAPRDPAPEGFVLAEKCKHALYPSSTDPPSSPGSWVEEGKIADTPSHCPVCTLYLHQNLIEALNKKWKKLGGPWRTGELVGEERIKYSDTTHAYHKAKVDLVNTIRSFEDATEVEKKWETTQTADAITLLKGHSAAKALDLYKASITFPAHLASPDQIPPIAPGPTRSRTRTLTYSPDTPENTKHRPQAFWGRGYTSHDPDSPHACPSEEGYWDTSYFNDWRFAVSQCRILLVQYGPDSLDLIYRDMNAGPDRGMGNPHVSTLITILEAFLAKQDEGMRARWVAYLKHTTDYFLVWKSEAAEGDAVFDLFERVVSLVGSHVEEYARRIGDIDDEEWAARKVEEGDEEEMEEGGEEEVD
ncbi:hypothetical protein CC86DRAFT_269639, partial [Ophiobolus disseminans]